jgi:DNA-binding LacI/PurR family transcriptional regulator
MTMQDIADAAGVSRMTVSLALRRSSKISAVTTRRVQKLCAAMGYRPDPLIQRLTTHLGQIHRRREGQVIAWINAWKNRAEWRAFSVYAAMYRGAVACARERGYLLQEFWLGEPGMTGKKLSRILYQRGIECLLIGPLAQGGGQLTMDWDKFSSVAIGYSMLAPQLNRVVNHQLHSAREAIRQLCRRGYRRIGLSTRVDDNLRADHSWLEAMAYHHLQIPARDRVRPLIHVQNNVKNFLRWIEKERPDSIIIQGAWLRDVLLKAGYKLPRDLGIALLDWPDNAPEMAGINQRHDAVGETAINIVVGQAYNNERGIPAVPRTVMVEGCWVDGNSIKSSA